MTSRRELRFETAEDTKGATRLAMLVAVALLGLTAPTPIYAAPEDSDWVRFRVTGYVLNILCNDTRDDGRCSGIMMLFYDLIETGEPIDGKRLCWPGGLSIQVLMNLVGTEMQAAYARSDTVTMEKSGLKILPDIFERHFPCGQP
jgi:hypothetical protein